MTKFLPMDRKKLRVITLKVKEFKFDYLLFSDNIVRTCECLRRPKFISAGDHMHFLVGGYLFES